jgi:K+-sensing histidine kinase KdpD
MIGQAVLNLMTNAIRVVGQGEEIMLSAHTNNGDAIVEVSQRRAGVLGSIRIPLAAATKDESQGP